MVLNAWRPRQRKRCQQTRVLLDGSDVTARCFYADGRRGLVRLYVHDDSGKPAVTDWDKGTLAAEVKRGRVRFIQRRHMANADALEIKGGPRG